VGTKDIMLVNALRKIHSPKTNGQCCIQSDRTSNDDNRTIASNPNPPPTVSASATTMPSWCGAQLQRINGVQFLLAENVDMRQVILADNLL